MRDRNNCALPVVFMTTCLCARPDLSVLCSGASSVSFEAIFIFASYEVYPDPFLNYCLSRRIGVDRK
jgi:hypothetical protein